MNNTVKLPTDKPLLKDESSRLAALDPTRSVVVTAPAGSGKTELLTRRILILLSRVEEPEEILAITFTRKAAAEMRERLLRNLRRVQSGDCATLQPEVVAMAQAVLARDQERDWQLLFNPQRLRVQTIDSFTGSLIANLPIQSGLGGRPRMTDNALSYYREAVRQVLNTFDTDESLSFVVGELLQHVDNRFSTLESLLVGLLEKRDQWLLLLGVTGDVHRARHSLEGTLQRLVEMHLADAYEALLPFSGALMDVVRYAQRNLRSLDPGSSLLLLSSVDELPSTDATGLAQWRIVYDFLFTKEGQLRKEKGITKRNGFPTDKKDVADVALAKSQKLAMTTLLSEMASRPGLVETLALIPHLPEPRFSDSQWGILSSLVILLPRLLAELKLVFSRQGEIDFTEQSLAALRAVGTADEHNELRYNVDQRLKHILVDEFQDTSMVQFRLLQSLVAEWDFHNQDNPHDPRTLFVVGDGMQSIYGFRAADVGLFLQARQKGVGPVVLDAKDLTVNFRSSPAIVQWVNEVFSKLFPQQDDPDLGASHHVHADAIRDNPGSVTLRGFVDDDHHRNQTQYCSEVIKEIRQNYPDGSIAVLVRVKSHLYPLIELFIQENIPWQAADIAPLVGRPAVQDLFLLLRALANPADRIAWLALLRSPLCGLNHADLFYVVSSWQREVQANSDVALPQVGILPIPLCVLINSQNHALTEHGLGVVNRLKDVLTLADISRERKPLRVWLEGIWLALGGARAYVSSVDAEDPWQDAEAFFQLLEQHVPYLTDFDEDIFASFLEKLFVNPVMHADKSVVQLMTMHKSKGLEFDTVILPYLDRISKADDKPLMMWDTFHGEYGPELMLAVKAEKGGVTDKIYDYLLHKRSRRNALEQTRLLYVAATRAKSRLFLTYGGKRNAKGELSLPPSTSLLNKLLPAFLHDDLVNEWNNSWQEPPVVNQALAASVRSIEQSVNSVTFIEPSWRMVQMPDDMLKLGEMPHDQDMREARAMGIAVHKILEIVVDRSVAFWTTMSVDVQHQYLTRLVESYLPVSSISSVVNKICRQLAAIFADEKALWMLSTSHQNAKAEWSLFVKTDVAGNSQRDEFSQSVIDRCFIADGVCWLIDYKTVEPLQSESLDEFVAREKNRHQPQLQRYAKMLSEIWNLPVKMVLYFTAIPIWCEL